MLTLQLSPFPVIETERLLLRRTTTGDAEALHFLRSDKRVMQYIDRPPSRDLQDAVDLVTKMDEGINSNTTIAWAICLKGSPTMAGSIGFYRTDLANHRGEVGYMLHPDYQRKGIMDEALKAVLDFGFTRLRFHTIFAVVNPDNAASIALLEKNKFVREAYFREDYYFEGKFLDSGIYCLITPLK